MRRAAMVGVPMYRNFPGVLPLVPIELKSRIISRKPLNCIWNSFTDKNTEKSLPWLFQ